MREILEDVLKMEEGVNLVKSLSSDSIALAYFEECDLDPKFISTTLHKAAPKVIACFGVTNKRIRFTHTKNEVHDDFSGQFGVIHTRYSNRNDGSFIIFLDYDDNESRAYFSTIFNAHIGILPTFVTCEKRDDTIYVKIPDDKIDSNYLKVERECSKLDGNFIILPESVDISTISDLKS